MKIAYFVHGRGRGHATRAQSVLPALQKAGNSVTLYAGAMAYSVLSNQATQIETVMPGLKGIKTLFKRINSDKKRFLNERPDLVISDGDAPCLYAAKKMNIPSIAIGHGVIIPYFHHTIPFPFLRFLIESINVWVSSKPADIKIGVHFDNLTPKTTNTFLAQPKIPEIEIETSTNIILCYFRDSNGTQIVKEIIKRGLVVHNFGVSIDGAINYPFNQDLFRQSFGKCTGIVASAGFNLVSEALYYQKPMLAMYKVNDFEQWMNATYLSKIKGYTASSFEGFNPHNLDHFIEKMKVGIKNNSSRSELPFLPDLLVEKIIPNLINK